MSHLSEGKDGRLALHILCREAMVIPCSWLMDLMGNIYIVLCSLSQSLSLSHKDQVWWEGYLLVQRTLTCLIILLTFRVCLKVAWITRVEVCYSETSSDAWFSLSIPVANPAEFFQLLLLFHYLAIYKYMSLIPSGLHLELLVVCMLSSCFSPTFDHRICFLACSHTSP